jgi:hypothetical protein
MLASIEGDVPVFISLVTGKKHEKRAIFAIAPGAKELVLRGDSEGTT